MDRVLRIVGNVLAVLGVLICLLSGLARLAGGYYLLGFETMTLYIGGVGIMVMACLAKLQRIK